MHLNVGKVVAALPRMTIKQLRGKYADVFGEESTATNKAWLVKRIAWRIQALAEGDLSERARRRATELANDADVRLNPPKLSMVSQGGMERTCTKDVDFRKDSRLPLPGTILTREYKGQTLQVKVLPRGFEYGGDIYKSLSALAKVITGQHCNGFAFFRLGKEGER